MVAEGAAIVDVGGESTRPGAVPVSAAEEQARVLPVIEALAATAAALISVDTYREETARLAVAAGAHIVNDVWGLQREPGIAARGGARPAPGWSSCIPGREREKLADVIADQFVFLDRSLEIARGAGRADAPDRARSRLRLRQGRRGKSRADGALRGAACASACRCWSAPRASASSGTSTGRDPSERDPGTAATSVILRCSGALRFSACTMSQSTGRAGHRGCYARREGQAGMSMD